MVVKKGRKEAAKEFAIGNYVQKRAQIPLPTALYANYIIFCCRLSRFVEKISTFSIKFF
jgi:hypothetical protein